MIAALLLGSAAAQPETSATLAVAARAPGASDPAALGFLGQVEAKHAETKSLAASFSQLRVDENFLEEVRSQGKFSYVAPNRFRAEYSGDDEAVEGSSVLIVGNRLYNYVPRLEQVDVVDLPEGESAAVHQMLLGFGVKVRTIEECFRVEPGEGGEPGERVLNFVSKDRRRTLNFRTVKITFDEASLQPKRLVMEDETSRTEITLSNVEVNPQIDPKVFSTEFPPDTEILYRGSSAGVLDVSEEGLP